MNLHECSNTDCGKQFLSADPDRRECHECWPKCHHPAWQASSPTRETCCLCGVEREKETELKQFITVPRLPCCGATFMEWLPHRRLYVCKCGRYVKANKMEPDEAQLKTLWEKGREAWAGGGQCTSCGDVTRIEEGLCIMCLSREVKRLREVASLEHLVEECAEKRKTAAWRLEKVSQ